MIQNIEQGSGFRGLVRYLFEDGKKAKLLGGTLSGRDPKELAQEAAVVRKLNKRANKVISHISLSLPPGERLTDEQWSEIAYEYIRRMGYDNCAWMAVRHCDTEHDHIHLGVIRIDMTDGKVVKNSWDYKRGEAIVRELEKEYGLSSPKPQKVSRRMTRNEINATLRTGEVSHRQRIAEAVDEALKTPCTLPEFIDRLAAAGVGVKLNMARTGRISGISFDLEGHVFKGSKIGKSYTWGRLQKRGVSYEENRDRTQVEQRQNSRNAQVGSDRNRSAGASAGGRDSDSRGHGAGARGSQKRDQGAQETGEAIGKQAGRAGIFGRKGERNRETESHYQVNPVRDLRCNADCWSNAVSSVGALATGIVETGRQSVQRTALSAATAAKIYAWRRQHEALQAPYYRITLTSRREHLKTFNLGKGRGADGSEKFYTSAEVESLIAYLSAQNIKGYDIYITPINPDFHYMVLDDTTSEKVRAAERKYGTPCLVQESSPNNVQAVFKVRRDARFKHEQQLANKVVQMMNKEFGDPNFSGVVHPFRIAGFSNKKLGKRNFFTRIKSARHVVSDILSDMLESLRAEELKQERHKEQQRTIQKLRVMSVQVGGGNDAWSAEKRRQLKFAESQVSKGIWQVVDESAVDYRTAKSLLEAGYSAEDVKAMMAQDAELAQRHPYTQDYISRTVSRADADRQAERSRSSKGMGM